MQGIHRGPVNSLHKWPVTRKMFPFDDVIMPQFLILFYQACQNCFYITIPRQGINLTPGCIPKWWFAIDIKFPKYDPLMIKDQLVLLFQTLAPGNATLRSIEVGQHWFWKCLVVWRHRPINFTDINTLRPEEKNISHATRHYGDVILGAMASQITSLPIDYLPFIRAQIKENIKAPRHWPLCGEFTGDRWTPRTNGL